MTAKPNWRATAVWLFVCSSALLTSCATIFNGSKPQDLKITSEPAGSEIFLNEELMQCKTPCTIKISKEIRRYEIRVDHKGYEPQTKRIGRGIAGSFWGSVGTAHVPFWPIQLAAGAAVLTDWLTGSMWKFNEKALHWELTKTGEEEEEEPVEEPKAPEPAGLTDLEKKIREIFPEHYVEKQITYYYGQQEGDAAQKTKARVYAKLIEQYVGDERLDIDEAIKMDLYEQD